MIFCSLQLGALPDHIKIKGTLKVPYIIQPVLPAELSEFVMEFFTTIETNSDVMV